MFPTILLIIVCLVSLVLTFKVATVVTEQTRRDGGDMIRGVVLTIIFSEFLTVEAGLLISRIFDLPSLDFLAWPTVILAPLEIIAYLVGYFAVGLFQAGLDAGG